MLNITHFHDFSLQNCLIKESSSNTSKFNIPELRVADADFPTDDVRNYPSMFLLCHPCAKPSMSFLLSHCLHCPVLSGILEEQFALQEPEASRVAQE